MEIPIKETLNKISQAWEILALLKLFVLFWCGCFFLVNQIVDFLGFKIAYLIEK